MKTNKLIKIVLASFMLMGIVSFQAANAQEYVPKVAKQKLHQAPLPGAEGKEMTVVHFAIPPGYVGGKHMHPGPVFVYVLEGELTVVLEGGTKTFKASQCNTTGNFRCLHTKRTQQPVRGIHQPNNNHRPLIRRLGGRQRLRRQL